MNKTFATIGTIAVLGSGGVFGADNVINPYIDHGDKYELPIASNFSQGERVHISKDKAEMTLRGWNDEYAIKVIPQIPTQQMQLGAERRDFEAQAKRPLFSKRMEYKQGDVVAFIEQRHDIQFDIDFTLDSKPDTNIFAYVIEGAEDFNFFYQPELTEEEKAKGHKRPENVIGSYAVYHKTKANHKTGSTNYATGKIMHIYRPKAIDADGKEQWAELRYADNLLTVTVPQSFLDTATYPVIVDPTFGYEQLGATDGFEIADNACGGATVDSSRWGWAYTAPDSGTLDSITFGLTGSGETGLDIKAFVNTEDAGANSHTQVATAIGTNVGPTSDSFVTVDLGDESISASTSYVLNLMGDGSSVSCTQDMKYDTGGSSRNEYFENQTYSSPESPWTEAESSTTNEVSIYATYTQSVSSGNIAFSTSTTYEGGYLSSHNFTVTGCSATDGLMILNINQRNPSSEITGAVTADGNTMPTQYSIQNTGVTGLQTHTYLNPDSSVDIVIPTSGFKLLSASVTCLSGVNQSTPVGATSTAQGFSGSVVIGTTTTATDSWLQGAITLQNARTVTINTGAIETTNFDHSDSNLGQMATGYKHVPSIDTNALGWSLSSADNYTVGIMEVLSSEESGGVEVVLPTQVIYFD